MKEKNKIEIIYAHKIEYWYKDNYKGEMNEVDIDHIKRCLSDNCHSGELCTSEKEKTHYGWWQVKKD